MLLVENLCVNLSDGFPQTTAKSKHFKERTFTLEEINFELKQAEHIAVMGHSGSGKSTLLKAIYGLLSVQKGALFYNEEKLLGPENYLVPGYNFMKYLAQDLGLMPYTSARENIGDFLSNFYPEEKKQKVDELLHIVGLTSKAEVHVRYLSGGQKQRVALARVLALEPKVLLLDEPFSQIDQAKKYELRHQIFSYLKEKNISCVTVTHDQQDVLGFADRVLVLRDGKQVAFEKTEPLVFNPYSKYIAQLFFTVNEIPAYLVSPDFNKDAPQKTLLYPWEISLKATDSGKFTVKSCFFSGSHYHIRAEAEGWACIAYSQEGYKVGQTLKISCDISLACQRIR